MRLSRTPTFCYSLLQAAANLRFDPGGDESIAPTSDPIASGSGSRMWTIDAEVDKVAPAFAPHGGDRRREGET